MSIFNFFKKRRNEATKKAQEELELKKRLAEKVHMYENIDPKDITTVRRTDDTQRDFTLQTRNKTDTTYYEMKVDDKPVELRDNSSVDWEDPRFRLSPEDFDDDTIPDDIIRFIGTHRNIHKK